MTLIRGLEASLITGLCREVFPTMFSHRALMGSYTSMGANASEGYRTSGTPTAVCKTQRYGGFGKNLISFFLFSFVDFIIYFMCIGVFCLNVCLCTTCTQCPQRLEECQGAMREFQLWNSWKTAHHSAKP